MSIKKLNKTFNTGAVLTAPEMSQITSKIDEVIDGLAGAGTGSSESLNRPSTEVNPGYYVLEKDKDVFEQIELHVNSEYYDMIIEVRYDFDLKGQELHFGNDCSYMMLYFTGGSFSNGSITSYPDLLIKNIVGMYAFSPIFYNVIIDMAQGGDADLYSTDGKMYASWFDKLSYPEGKWGDAIFTAYKDFYGKLILDDDMALTKSHQLYRGNIELRANLSIDPNGTFDSIRQYESEGKYGLLLGEGSKITSPNNSTIMGADWITAIQILEGTQIDEPTEIKATFEGINFRENGIYTDYTCKFTNCKFADHNIIAYSYVSDDCFVPKNGLLRDPFNFAHFRIGVHDGEESESNLSTHIQNNLYTITDKGVYKYNTNTLVYDIPIFSLPLEIGDGGGLVVGDNS